MTDPAKTAQEELADVRLIIDQAFGEVFPRLIEHRLVERTEIPDDMQERYQRIVEFLRTWRNNSSLITEWEEAKKEFGSDAEKAAAHDANNVRNNIHMDLWLILRQLESGGITHFSDNRQRALQLVQHAKLVEGVGDEVDQDLNEDERQKSKAETMMGMGIIAEALGVTREYERVSRSQGGWAQGA